MPGTLYLVATPIGNLEDITLRALRILREADVVAAEDTRRTMGLLQHYQISHPVISLHDHNERQRTPALLARLRAGESIAVVSDAGTPLISDPGLHLVREALAAGIRVEAIPGPSALTAALAVSGISLNEFTFLGFPPGRAAARDRWMAALADERRTLILFETPHRIRATLATILRQLGDRFVVLARELTKVHETVSRGPVSGLLAAGVEERGEYVVLVESPSSGADASPAPPVTDDELATEFGELTNYGAVSGRDAATMLAKRYGVSRQHVFKAARRVRPVC
jgi:16S rRNA (cytidine1402-2'-O)-methyltransferase